MILLIFSWIIFGSLVGWITALTVRSEESVRFGLNMAVGIIGALIGGFILTSLNVSTGLEGLYIASLITAVVGSVLMIAVVRGFDRA